MRWRALRLLLPLRGKSGARKQHLARRLAFEEIEKRLVPVGCTVAANTCFAVIGDYGNGSTASQDVAQLVKGWNADFIVTTGDNNYPNGAASTIDANVGQLFHEYIFPYTGQYGAGASTNKFFPALGNHDWRATNAQPYLDYFKLPGNERYYEFRKGPVEFFIIDSDDHEPHGNTGTSVQGQWLKNQLATSTLKWKLVLFHHAPYSSGSTHGSDLTMQWPFASWGATAVISGHVHNYERLLKGSLPYFVNGSGGATLYGFSTPISGSKVRYNADHGAMLIDATDSQIKFMFVNRSGTVIDTYTIGQAPQQGPTVTLEATDLNAAEPTDNGKVTVRRSGSTANPLTVAYAIGGTAINGTDYQSLAGTVTIAAGSATALIKVVVKNDSLVESTETATITLSSSSAYLLGSAKSATIQVKDDDSGGGGGSPYAQRATRRNVAIASAQPAVRRSAPEPALPATGARVGLAASEESPETMDTKLTSLMARYRRLKR